MPSSTSTTPPILTFIIGCTGCGKGSLARELARRTGGEIVSIDSMKVYRGMDIGTAKPSLALRQETPHHLIDVVDPQEEFSVAQYLALAEPAVRDIHNRNRPIFFVGGTPLYLKAMIEGLFDGPGADEKIRSRLQEIANSLGSAELHRQLAEIDPDSALRIHPNDSRRMIRALEVYELTGSTITELQTQWDRDRTKYPCILIGLRRDREDQSHRTNQRAQRMVKEGLIEEVRSLVTSTGPLSTSARQAVGYAEMIRHINGEISLDEALELIKINTRHLAKSQRTWFKRFLQTEWTDLMPLSKVEDIADDLISRRGNVWSV